MTNNLNRHTDTVSWVAMAGLGLMAQAVCAEYTKIRLIEIFTTSDRPVISIDYDNFESIHVTLYEVDGLERFESELSRELPRHPTRAQSEAVRRIQQLEPEKMARARASAIGLAEAMRYGIDRYPAIVFDGHAVVYGVNDLGDALDRYTAWQNASAR